MNKVEYYIKSDGTVPVADFLDDLPDKLRAKAIRDIDILDKHGTKLKMPYEEQIEGKLWQLRIRTSGDSSRIFYFVYTSNKIILLHGFMKKTPRTPKREIAIAKSYMTDHLMRYPNDAS